MEDVILEGVTCYINKFITRCWSLFPKADLVNWRRKRCAANEPKKKTKQKNPQKIHGKKKPQNQKKKEKKKEKQAF